MRTEDNSNPGTQDAQTSEESTRLSRVAEQAKETLEKVKDGVAAGAVTVAGAAKTVAQETREKVGQVAEFVREAETDAELKEKVAHTTEDSLHAAGDRVSGAAPAIGRGAEVAAEKVGAALHAVAGPLAAILGAIAGTIGGWWKKASESMPDLPHAEEEACRAHFVTVTARPAGMTFDRARTGYALGYIAGRNPDYRGRAFDDIEPDLRQGFPGDRAGDYDLLRDYARYGYERGTGIGSTL